MVGNSYPSANVYSIPFTVPDTVAFNNSYTITGNSQVSLFWNAPVNNGNTITAYYVTYYNMTYNTTNIVALTGSTLNTTISNLINGNLYIFNIVASNAAGNSVISTASNTSVTPYTISNSPLSLSATSGNTSVSLTWSAPSFNGGNTITAYNLYNSTISTTVPVYSGLLLSNTVSGLVNGNTYVFYVTAQNLAGNSVSNSVSAIPYTLPSAPQSFSATGGLGSAALSWSAPSSNGGTAITYYNIFYGIGLSYSTSLTPNLVVGPGVTSNTVTGLTGGSTYNFYITAQNLAGNSSSASVSATTFNVPSAPQSLIATNGSTSGSANVSWNAPLYNGGTAITYYNIFYGVGLTYSLSLKPNIVIGPGVTSNTVTGLTIGSTYNFFITAQNIVGNSIASNTASLIIATPAGSIYLNNLLLTSSTSSIGQIPIGSVDSDYTIECWVNMSQLPTFGSNGIPTLLGWDGITWAFGPSSTGYLTYYLWTGSLTFKTSSTKLSGNTWYHIAVVFVNSTSSITFYVDGVNTETFTGIPSFKGMPSPGSQVLTIGKVNNGTFYGYMSNLRITNSAVYTSNFTVPTSILTALPQTVVLMNTLYSSTNANYLTDSMGSLTFTYPGSNISSYGPSISTSITYSVPFAPSSFSATPGSGSTALSWSASSYNGGSAIIYYNIFYGIGLLYSTFLTPNLVVGPGVTSNTVTGLTSGSSYNFYITAQNVAGNSIPASASATPFTVPSAPLSFTATSGPGSAALSWSSPSSNGGSAITYYNIFYGIGLSYSTFLTPNLVVGSGVTTYNITGLTPGTTYTFYITAQNVMGNSIQASASASANPYTVPSVPQSFTASGGSGSVALSWTAPSSNGGTAITYYNIFYGVGLTYSTSLKPNIVVGSGITTYNVSGLTAGTNYTFYITAQNIIGNSTQISASATTYTLPSVPQSFTATGGSGSAALSWSAPSSNGGTAITYYNIFYGIGLTYSTSLTPNLVIGGGITTYNVTGLSDSSTYSFYITAQNVMGNSIQASASATTAAPLFQHPAIDSNGNIYVTNISSQTVMQYNSSKSQTNSSYISGLSSPTGICIDSYNNLYVCNSTLGTVSQYNSSGLLVNASFISGLTSPIGICINPRAQNNMCIVTSGNIVTTNISYTTPTTSTTALYSPFPTGIVSGTQFRFCPIFDLNGDLYHVPGSTYSSVGIGKYNVSGHSTSASFLFNYTLMDLAIDLSNNLWCVANDAGLTYLNKRISNVVEYRLDVSNIVVSCNSFCIDNNNNAFLTSTNGKLVKLTRTFSNYLYSTSITPGTSTNYPNGVDYDSNNNIYAIFYNTAASGNFSCTVAKYDNSLNTLNASFILTPGLSGANGQAIAIDRKKYNTIYLACAKYIFIYSINGTLLNQLSGFANVVKIRIYNNALFWVDNYANICQTTINYFGTKNTSLSSGLGCAFDNSNNLYVVKSSSVSKYDLSGSLINTSFITGLTNSNDITISNTNNIYIKSNNTIVKYDNSGTLQSYTPTFTPSLNNPSGVSFSSLNNTLYVFNNGSNSLSSTTSL